MAETLEKLKLFQQQLSDQQLQELERKYEADKAAREKAGGKGAKKAYKKRHFQLKQDSLQFAASVKVDAKVLVVVSLDGASVKVDGVDIVVTDGQGRENELRARTAAEAKKWSEAIDRCAWIQEQLRSAR